MIFISYILIPTIANNINVIERPVKECFFSKLIFFQGDMFLSFIQPYIFLLFLLVIYFSV